MQSFAVMLLYALGLGDPATSPATSEPPAGGTYDEKEASCQPGPRALAVVEVEKESIEVCHKSDPNDAYWICIEWICPDGLDGICFVGEVTICPTPHCRED